MEKRNKTDKGYAFEHFPVDLETIKAYTEKHTWHVEAKGHYITKALLNSIILMARCLTWKGAYRVGAWIGKLMYRLKIRRDVAMTNLDIVYGETKSVEEKDLIYYNSMINLGRVAINRIRLPYQSEKFWRENCEFDKEEIFQKAMNKKKGVLLIAGHIGMFDLAGGKFGMCGYPISVIGRKISNPVINKFIVDSRSAMNLCTVRNKNSMERILEGLTRGEAIAMSVDQCMRKSRGVFVDWMGHPAYSVRSAAYVARESGAPVLSGFFYQTGPDRFKLSLNEETPYEVISDDPEKELQVNTQKQSYEIQKIIWDHPELWFWLHKRYKVQPEGMSDPYKASETEK